eukprot:1029146-Amphidinium_carterae.1
MQQSRARWLALMETSSSFYACSVGTSALGGLPLLILAFGIGRGVLKGCNAQPRLAGLVRMSDADDESHDFVGDLLSETDSILLHDVAFGKH